MKEINVEYYQSQSDIMMLAENFTKKAKKILGIGYIDSLIYVKKFPTNAFYKNFLDALNQYIRARLEYYRIINIFPLPHNAKSFAEHNGLVISNLEFFYNYLTKGYNNLQVFHNKDISAVNGGPFVYPWWSDKEVVLRIGETETNLNLALTIDNEDVIDSFRTYYYSLKEPKNSIQLDIYKIEKLIAIYKNIDKGNYSEEKNKEEILKILNLQR